MEDPTFLNWVTRVNEQDFQKWQSFKEQHTESAEIMEEARLMLTRIYTGREKLTVAEKKTEWGKLARHLPPTGKTDKTLNMTRRKWWMLAASIAIITVTGLALSRLFSTTEPLEYKSPYGEILKVTLPDGSSVILNANSKLTCPGFWKAGQAMQVELEGEAFFHVTGKAEENPFIVRTQGMDVEVMGTRFNVKARHEVAVSLLEGKVRMYRPGIPGNLTLEPGQAATYDEASGKFLVLEGGIGDSISWTERLWVFNNTPLPEVLRRIEDEFGIPCRLNDPVLAERRVSGKVSTGDRRVLFRALSSLLDIEIREMNGQLVFTPLAH